MRRNPVPACALTYVMRLLGVLLAVVCGAAACSSSSPVASISPRPSHSPSPNTVQATQMCFISPPADWQAAMSKPLTTLDGVNVGAEAIDDHDGIAFGQSLTAADGHVVALDLSTGKLTTLAAGSSKGIPWMTFGDGWLAWPQVGLGGSTIQLYNATTHERREIATSGPPGTAAIANGYVAWNESATETTNALRVYRFGSGDTVTLDTGLVQPPVFAGRFLVWTKSASLSSPQSLVFADATTLEPVPAPAELRASRTMYFLSGSPDRLLWNDRTAWYVDELATGSIRSYKTAPGHYLQFPDLAEPYLAWFGADRNSIVDLRSGVGFDIPLPGDVAAAGDTVVVVKLAATKGADRSDVSVLHPSQLSPLRGSC